METTAPSTVLGTAVFFGLLAMVAWLLIRETLRIVLKPALVVAILVLLAVWAGLLEGTAVEAWLSWIGDRLIAGAAAASDWTVRAFEASTGSGPPAD